MAVTPWMKGMVWEMVAHAAQMAQKCSRVMADLTDRSEEALYERISQIIEAARTHVSRTVNTAMVHAYWLIGREIVEVEQQGKERAEYGESLVKRLAARLTERFGKGFTASNVKRMRQLYSAFPHGSCIPEELGGPPKGAAVRRLPPQAGKGAALRHLEVENTLKILTETSISSLRSGLEAPQLP